MNIDNVHLSCSAPSSACPQKKTYRKTVSHERPCFNRALRRVPPSQGASKTAPGYLPRNTTDSRLPRVVQDFQIGLSCTDQPDPVATNGGQWLNSRKRPVFDPSEVEWVSRKVRKKEFATTNANSACQPVAGTHQRYNIQHINKGFNSLSAGNNDQALKIAEKILTTHAHLSLRDCQNVNLLKARALFNLKRFDDCLQFIGKMKFPPDKGLLMVKGRALQAKNHFPEALSVFKELYINHSKSARDKKVNGMALGRLYEDMGRHQEALTIFKKLRTDLSGHESTPCEDKGIELTLGRLYQFMGLHQEALTIFKKLRTDHSGHEDTPCSDKDIELTLGRQYQKMGWHQEALTTFIKLRTDRSGHEDTPCNDKDIELTLGRQYQDMGLYQEALTTFKKLRTDRSGHEEIPCNDKEVELALGDIHINLMNWQRFDQLQLAYMGFAGPEVDLCISVRYFRDCIFSGQDKEVSGLLAKAIEHACNAVEKSHYLNASSFSQLVLVQKRISQS